MSTRRRTTVVLALLIGSALTPVAAAAPASAAEGCLHDVSRTVFETAGCDDTTAPDTLIGATAPRINAAGWANKHTIRVGLSGRHTDADTDPTGLECRLSLDPALPDADDWAACPTDGVFKDLEDTAAKPYVLWVRAYDSADRSTTWMDWVANPFNPTVEPVDDVDPTPAKLVFSVDTVIPDTYLFDTPYDPLRPDLPMVMTPSPRLRLAATEAASYRCVLDTSLIPCAAGWTTLRSLSPGDHRLRVQAVDPAGNVDPTAATTRLAVPQNLRTKAKGWKRVTNGGYLGSDYLLSRTKGAVFSFKVGSFRELRLLASTGPSAGVVELKIGETWHRVNLQRSTASGSDQIQVLDEFAPQRKGRIWVRVASANKRVQIDGVLAH